MTRTFITAAASATVGILVGFVAGAGLMAVRLGEDSRVAAQASPASEPRARRA